MSLICLCTCRITATFFDEKDGTEKAVHVAVGESMMEAAHANNIDLEGGPSAGLEACYWREVKGMLLLR